MPQTSLTSLRAGQVIREPWVHQLVRTVNELQARVARIENKFQMGIADNFQQMYSGIAGEVSNGSMPTSITFTEATRGAASAAVTDTNGDTHYVYIATSIVMTASNAGTSYQWTFHFASS